MWGNFVAFEQRLGEPNCKFFQFFHNHVQFEENDRVWQGQIQNGITGFLCTPNDYFLTIYLNSDTFDEGVGRG